MKPKIIEKCLTKVIKLRKYNNIVEAASVSKIMRILSGTAVYSAVTTPGDRVESKFCIFGFVCIVLDICVYFYCMYKAHVDDQTIVRTIYDTKLRRYGDDVERTSSVIFILYAIWKIPFHLNGSRHMFQQIVDIDKQIEKMGEIIDYNKNALSSMLITLGQVLEYALRLSCVWIALDNLNVDVPIERLYQIVYTDTMSLMMISRYCFLLIVLRDRYRYLNKILTEIQERNAWEYKVFMRTKFTYDVNKAEQLQYRSVCEKISSCSKVYATLFKSTNSLNGLFGTGLVLTMFIYLLSIILYMFYFMEATAGGLFLDAERYLDFLMCVFWQISHGLFIIYAIVYFSESTVNEATKVAFVTHGIIQKDIHPDINTEAMQLSLQILHQKPKFTANGLVDLNNALLYDGVRSVFTYLIILLQFVTESN